MARRSPDTTRERYFSGSAAIISLYWLRVMPSANANMSEVLMAMLAGSRGDDVGHRLPLVGLLVGVPGALEQVAQVVAADCHAFNRLVVAGVVEHQDRASPRMHALGIEHGGDHR